MGATRHDPGRQDRRQTARLLKRIGDWTQGYKAAQRLPQVLAALLGAGETDLVLAAVAEWGRGGDPAAILDRLETHAAVLGLRHLFE